MADIRPVVALLTGGGDRPYALGLAFSLIAEGVPFDFVGSDELSCPDLERAPMVRVLNLRGDVSSGASYWSKVIRIAVYYLRLLRYAAGSDAGVFHILWNNKFEFFDRTMLQLYYRLLGKRIVHTVHNVNIRKRDGNDSALNRWSLWLQYRMAHHLFVHTERMKQELVEDFGVAPCKVTRIPFGINDTLPRTSMGRDEARARLGLESSDRAMLFFGNIAPYKGLEYLIEALALSRREIPECRLIIAGRKKGAEGYWAKIERRMDELGIRDRVTPRIEFIPDAEAEVYFKATDVLVLPYVHVFQSGVLFLGYAFGVSVIATDVGSLREDIIDGETGLVCRPRDADDLARAIKEYFGSEMFLSPAARADRIRQFAEDRYSWDKVGAACKAVYVRLTNRRM